MANNGINTGLFGLKFYNRHRFIDRKANLLKSKPHNFNKSNTQLQSV